MAGLHLTIDINIDPTVGEPSYFGEDGLPNEAGLDVALTDIISALGLVDSETVVVAWSFSTEEDDEA